MVLAPLDASRRWIIAGFALFFLSSAVNLINQGSALWHAGFRFDVQAYLSPVSALLVLWGWSILSRFEVRDSAQRRALVAGFLALAAQFAVSCFGELMQRTRFLLPLDRYNGAFWLMLLANAISAIGFTYAAHTTRRTQVSADTTGPRELSHSPGSYLIFAGYALVALALIVILYFDVANQFFVVAGLRNAFQTFAQPLAAILTAAGWWFISGLSLRDQHQRALIHQAYWMLGLALAATAVQQFLAVSEVSVLTRYTWEIWMIAFGAALGAVGFILSSRREPAPATSDGRAHAA